MHLPAPFTLKETIAIADPRLVGLRMSDVLAASAVNIPLHESTDTAPQSHPDYCPPDVTKYVRQQ